MKKVLLLLSFTLVSNLLMAQTSSVIGTVKDKNKKGVQDVNIMIPGIKKGTSTDETGRFKLDNVPNGNYNIVASFIGYQTKTRKIYIEKGEQLEVNFTISKSIGNLKNVTIASTIGASEIKPQKVTFSSVDLASQTGGTAGDILENMPSVSMGGSPGENKDIRYRGLGKEYTKVLINGRNAGVTGDDRQTILDLIPASQIERIEIRSNPSASVQSDGVNGIVNIILKDGVSSIGSGGNVGLIADSEEGYNGSAQYSQAFENFQFTVGLDKLKRKIDKFDDGTITKFDDNGEVAELTTIDKDELKTYDNTGARVNLNYTLSDDISFQAEYLYGDQNQSKEKEELNLTSNPDGQFLKGKNRVETEEKNLTYHNSYFGTQANIGSGVLSADINVNLSEEAENKIRNDFKTDANGNALELDGPKRQRENEIISTDVINPSLNYETTKNNVVIQAGYQGFYTEFTSKFDKDRFNFEQGIFENAEAPADNYVIQENVNAFFTTAEWYKGKWSIEGGLRYEIADVKSTSSDKSIDEGKNNYDFFLPNLHIVYDVSEKSYLNFSIGRRLRRPSYEDLNPYEKLDDINEIERGNPNLTAESSWAFEVGYLRNFDKFNFGTNLFLRDIDDLIQENTFQNDEGFIVEEPENLNGAVVYGAEFFVSANVTSWWDTNLSYSLFESEIKETGGKFDGDALKDQTDWTAKAINDFNVTEDATIQIAGNIVGPQSSSQKTEEIIWSFDAGFEKRFMKNGTFILRVVDIFDTLGKDKAEFAGNQVERKTENTQGQIFSAGLRWNF